MEIFAAYGVWEWVYLIGCLVGLGAVAGFLAGLLGVGGGIVLVPGLYYVFTFLGFDSPYLIHIAVGTSLAIIVPTGLSSARAHYKKGAVDMGLVKHLGSGILIGVIIGTLIIGELSGNALKMVFASALLLLAIKMLISTEGFKIADQVPGQPLAGVAGGIIGTLSTLIGIGGATISVPFMTLCQVPIRRAIGTASAMGLVIAIPASLGSMLIGWEEEARLPLSLGFVNIPAWLCIIPVSVAMAPIGAWAAHKVPVKRLKQGFAIFMIFVAARMWYELL